MAKNIKLGALVDTIMENDDYTKPIILVEHGGTNMATTFLRYRDCNFLHAMVSLPTEVHIVQTKFRTVTKWNQKGFVWLC